MVDMKMDSRKILLGTGCFPMKNSSSKTNSKLFIDLMKLRN